MEPTEEMIDKAARRGALLQDVQVIMWEFTKKRESDESVSVHAFWQEIKKLKASCTQILTQTNTYFEARLRLYKYG